MSQSTEYCPKCHGYKAFTNNQWVSGCECYSTFSKKNMPKIIKELNKLQKSSFDKLSKKPDNKKWQKFST